LKSRIRPSRHENTKVRAGLSSCLGTLLIALFSSSCNTLPVGYDQVHDRVTGTSDTTLLPDSAASYARYVPLGGSSILYLGRDTSYVSRIVLRFSMLDTMSLDSITSFQLVLHQQDTLATMSFVCHPCSSEWTENGVSWQMADSFNHWPTAGGNFLPDTLASGTILGDSAIFDFRYVEFDSTLRATIRDCGIGIFPQDTGIVAIYSGASTTTAPRLRVTYTNKGKQTQRIINDIADASLIDTVATGSLPFDLLVGSGVAFRTWLSFDIDSIPAEATIARADLKFRPETKYRRTGTIVLGASRLTESYAERGANARSESLPSAYSTYLVPADSDTAVTIDIRSTVQLWTSRSDTLHNYGLLITASPEWSELFRLRIPRSGPDAPRLEIQYVLPPEDRFR
jgi:hypothetical protein